MVIARDEILLHFISVTASLVILHFRKAVFTILPMSHCHFEDNISGNTRKGQKGRRRMQRRKKLSRSELILSVSSTSFMVRFGSTLDLPHPKAPGGDFIKIEWLKQIFYLHFPTLCRYHRQVLSWGSAVGMKLHSPYTINNFLGKVCREQEGFRVR